MLASASTAVHECLDSRCSSSSWGVHRRHAMNAGDASVGLQRGRGASGGWRTTGRDHAIGAALAFLYVSWLLSTARSLGFSRDEGFYFHAASDYARWFEILFTHPSEAF